MEVLISLCILSDMLLGLDGMQVITLRQVKSSYYISVAANQLTNMLERLHALHGGNPLQQLRQWNEENALVLPQGRGFLHANKLILVWGNATMESCENNHVGVSGCLQLALN